VKIGDCVYDTSEDRIVGSGTNTFLLSREEYGSDLAPPISLDSRLARKPGSREKGVLDVSQAEGVGSDRRSWNHV
jgi:hypothetical protein